jgi:hypothetical protein
MKSGSLLKNKCLINILSALAIAFFGFILLNLTFIFDALYQGIIRRLVGLFIPLGPESRAYWLPPLMHLSFIVIIGIISWLVFRSDLKKIYKAIFLSVPVATVLVTIGMFLSQFPLVLYPLGFILCAATLYLFFRTNQPWLYYFTVILFSIVLAVFTLMGGEI